MLWAGPHARRPILRLYSLWCWSESQVLSHTKIMAQQHQRKANYRRPRWRRGRQRLSNSFTFVFLYDGRYGGVWWNKRKIWTGRSFVRSHLANCALSECNVWQTPFVHCTKQGTHTGTQLRSHTHERAHVQSARTHRQNACGCAKQKGRATHMANEKPHWTKRETTTYESACSFDSNLTLTLYLFFRSTLTERYRCCCSGYVCVCVRTRCVCVFGKRTMSNTQREKVAAESSGNNNNGNGARIVCSVENFMRDVWYLLVCEMCVFRRDHFFVNSSSDTNVAALTRIFTKRSRTIF